MLRWLAAACRLDDAPVGPPPDGWDEVLGLARRHRVQSLLHAGLTRRGCRVPRPIQKRLHEDARANAAQNLRSAVQCKRLNEAFAEAGVPLLFVKGLTLSQLAYRDANLKMSRDIDVLVRPQDVPRAGKLLLDLGFSAECPGDPEAIERWHRWSKESSWRGCDGLLVELHSRLTDHPGLLPQLRADAHARSISIAPGISLPTLPQPELLAYLAVHGASSAWFRLKWLADLDALLGREELDLTRLHEAMLDHGAGRAAGQALLLLGAVYERPLPPALRDKLERDIRTRWLAAEALRQLASEREPTDRPGGTIGIHATQLLIGEHWSFPLSEAWRRAGDVLVRRFTAG